MSIMQTDTLGYWNIKREKLKLRFPLFADEDLQYHEGKEKEMIEILAYKLRKTKLELIKIIETL
jgi:hypothetical protein